MTTARSAELDQVHHTALEIARETGQRLSSAHLLLAMFTVPNLAELLLLERDVNEETLLACMSRLEREPPDTLDALLARSREIARSCDADQVDCLHVLAACTGQPRSFAFRLLERTGVEMTRLQSTARRYATHGVPRRLLRAAEALRMDDAEVQARDSLAYNTLEYATLGVPVDRDTAIDLPAVGGETVEAPSLHRTTGRHAVRRGFVEPTARDRRDRRDRGPGRRQADQKGIGGGRRRSDKVDDPTPDEATAEASPTPAGQSGAEPERPSALAPNPAQIVPEVDRDDEDVPSPFVLNRERFPTLTRLGRNLSHLAWLGRFDPVFGREGEIEQALDVLHKRRSNNPCLVGEPGVGKTAIVEGVAMRLAALHARLTAPAAPERVVIQVDVGAIMAGTHLRGALAERLRGLQDEVRQAAGRVVIFIDEIHTLMGGSGGDGHDAANELKAALARGEFPCIGATTIDEYRESIEADPAMERRFTAVQVDEPDEPATLQIVAGVADRYAAHHKVEYTAEAIEAAVRLGRRYLHDRCDPDKSLGVLDLAGAVARRSGGTVDRRAVAEVISRMARVPVDHLMVDDPQRFLEMEERLGAHIIGQRHVLSRVAGTIRRNLAGFAGGRPIGSFLFLGPTGVGKTEAVKALARFLFGSGDALMRFDMSEYLEAHSVSRLIGSPPGYVGHDSGGQLTDRIRRRPYQVVLFDEIEKSHRDVWNVLLQILDDGRLTDGKGRTVDFSNTVVVMTSNLGAEAFAAVRHVGFAPTTAADPESRRDAALDSARKAFPPELWNRIECRLVFDPLDRDEVARVARLQLADRAGLLESERGITFAVDDAAIAVLIDAGGYDEGLGARPMRQAIARHVESPLAEKILSGTLRRGQHVDISADGDHLRFTVVEGRPEHG